MMERFAISIACFVAAFTFASLVEYWVHRLMHQPLKLGERHREHHRRNEGQGVIREFLDYVRGSFIGMIPLFFVSFSVGMGWLLGALAYSAFSAYAHQLQHENPIKCFWMRMPIHYVHHKYGMWEHNFGLAVDWWDHVFGTYQAVNWLTEDEQNESERGYLRLRWW